MLGDSETKEKNDEEEKSKMKFIVRLTTLSGDEKTSIFDDRLSRDIFFDALKQYFPYYTDVQKIDEDDNMEGGITHG